MDNSVILLLGGIVLISILDVMGNLIGFIPIIGDVISTTSEGILEVVQLALVGILATKVK